VVSASNDKARENDDDFFQNNYRIGRINMQLCKSIFVSDAFKNGCLWIFVSLEKYAFKILYFPFPPSNGVH
jgi:hypothetical protein